MAVLGFSIGALFLWLALGKVDFLEVETVASSLDPSVIAYAALLYWLAIMIRVVRWQLLLKQIAAAPLLPVMEILIVGYAVNNVLPARLGEVVRAAYAKRRLRIGRARVFGSIVIERFLDLVAILSCLVIGLLMFRVIDDAGRLPTFELVALNAGAVIGLTVLGIFIVRSGNLGKFKLPSPMLVVFDDFRHGLTTLNRNSVVLAAVLTIGIWFFEVACAGPGVQGFRRADRYLPCLDDHGGGLAEHPRAHRAGLPRHLSARVRHRHDRLWIQQLRRHRHRHGHPGRFVRLGNDRRPVDTRHTLA